MILVPAYLLVWLPASWLVKRLLKPWIDQIQSGASPTLVNAGAMIGYLERFLILTFVLLGEYTAMGFVLALKAAYDSRTPAITPRRSTC